MKCVCTKRCTSCESALHKDLWRLRVNWLFLFVVGGLYAVSYTSISSSFHQFVTNPSEKDLNGSNSTMETGLGQTETFYSIVISMFNVGALVGAVVCGFLVKCLPYWHLLMFSLFAHTIGYVIYAVTYLGWLIVISKFLSGIFIGAELTLALSYFAESSIEYEKIRSEMDLKKNSSSKLRNMLFALHNIGMNIGYIFGPGLAVIFAQFEFDQFRSIAWYNVALGIGCMVLLLVMFHGESSCRKAARELNTCCSKISRDDFKIKPFEAFILVFLIILRGVLSFRFGAYETIYNPVLADYFGFDERDSSYFFFGLALAQIIGTLLLIVLQKINLGSRSIAVIGLLITLIGFLLMADWQAIPYDKCTEYSPFHHADIIDRLQHTPRYMTKRDSCEITLSHALHEFQLVSNSKLEFSSNHFKSVPRTDSIRFSCQISNICHDRCNEETSEELCLHFSNEFRCLRQLDDTDPKQFLRISNSYECSTEITTFSFCVVVYETSESPSEATSIQTIQHLPPKAYHTAMSKCLGADNGTYECYWNPQSIVTNKHCEDCQPICRSISHSLTFVQFLLGAALQLVAIPVAWVPVAALISNRVSTAAQGIVMGFMVALTAIGRSVSPIWLDAAYEGVGKRTFLAMILLSATHLPFLVGILVLFQKLKTEPAPHNDYSKLSSDQSDAE